MSFNTKITITWELEEHQFHAELRDNRIVLLASLEAQGKTDNVPQQLSPTITERFFIDVAAAEEYQDKLTKICNTYSVPAPTFVIS